ncbi:hypothetical protein JCGZ_22092 [Jatropha curcas]|uniref:Uncharacterized protein n=1 Tax=Jatropha curcas TaxID=180498 RepID=A0A067K5H6_JATCU|nr:hypothetical protein JCGZ_22092 [Jatropha curcas]
MAVIVGKPEHGPGAFFSFIVDYTGQTAQDMLETHLVSIDDYNKVCHLYEAARLKRLKWRILLAEVEGHSAEAGDGRKLVIIEEAEESSSDASEETASNIF